MPKKRQVLNDFDIPYQNKWSVSEWFYVTWQEHIVGFQFVDYEFYRFTPVSECKKRFSWGGAGTFGHNLLFRHQYFPVHELQSLINIMTFNFRTIVDNFITILIHLFSDSRSNSSCCLSRTNKYFQFTLNHLKNEAISTKHWLTRKAYLALITANRYFGDI